MITALALAVCVCLPSKQTIPPGFQIPHRPLALQHPVQDKNFYLLSLIERDPKMRQLLSTDTVLRQELETRLSQLESGFKSATFGRIESLGDFLWSEEQIERIAERLQTFVLTTKDGKRFVQETLRPSGAYFRHSGLTDDQLIAKAWRECAEGINSIIRVYGLQTQKARTPDIDSPFYLKEKTPLYGGIVKTLLGVLNEEKSQMQLAFQPSLRVATELLEAHMRDESGRFEPMELGENKAAFDRAKKVDWTKYKYSVILVPGLGPEEAKVPLSPVAKMVLRLAAARYRNGLAPFIVVSGGFVHPAQTPYSEASEMKRSLIRDEHIPEAAIILEPHARHTTTNLRNTVRLIYRYGLPMAKSGLITTNTYQADDIVATSFTKRCQGVFGYQPATNYRKSSAFDVLFTPNPESLSIDPNDPLDP